MGAAKWKKFIHIHLCVIVCIVMTVGSADCAAYRFINIGDLYPPFCAQQFHRKQECSSSYENKILVLSFFTLPQTKSQKVLLDLQDLSIKYANVSFVGILSGEADLQALDEFLETNKIEIPILLDPDRKIYGDFGVFMYPSTGIFSQDKRLKYYLPARRINFKTHVDGYNSLFSLTKVPQCSNLVKVLGIFNRERCGEFSMDRKEFLYLRKQLKKFI